MEVRLTANGEVRMHAFTLRRHGGTAALLLVPALLHCASSGMPPRATATGPVSDASVITRPQIDSLINYYQNGYDLIRSFRPNMLASRDVRLSGVNVVIDNVRAGGVEELRKISSRSMILVRFLSPTEAAIRYGSGMGAGVIAVTTSAEGWR